MSFKNFLDLRKKAQPQIQVVEHIILQKRSLKSDIFLALSVMLVASGIIWGISKADTIVSSFSKSQTKNFSASGIVLNIDPVNLYMEEAKGSDDAGKTSYTLDISNVTKIETTKYEPLSISDIQLGAKVVVQGKENGGNITIKRIIYFGILTPKEVIATTTEEIATTTMDAVIPAEAAIQSENDNVSTTTTDSPSIIDTIKDVASNVIDAITGTTTPEESGTSTVLSSSGTPGDPSPDPTMDSRLRENDNAGTSTPESSATPTPSIIENVSNTITDTAKALGDVVNNTIDTIVDVFSGTATSTNTESTNTSNGTSTTE